MIKSDYKIPSDKDRGKGVPFSRIRRITGYLVGDLSTWNSAKLAEQRDRVSHSVCSATEA